MRSHLKQTFLCYTILLLSSLNLLANSKDIPKNQSLEAHINKGIELKYRSPDTAQLYYDSVRLYLSQQQDTFSEIETNYYLAKLLKNEGILASILNDHPQAFHKLNESLNLFRSMGDSINMASVYSNIGVVHYFSSDFDKALENFKISSHIYLQAFDTSSYIDNLSRVAVIYYYTNNYDSAIYYNRLVIKEKTNRKENINWEEVAYDYNNIAISYQSLGNYDSAMIYLYKVLSIYDTIDDPQVKSTALSNIGDIYQERNEIEKALEYYHHSMELLEKQSNQHDVAKNCISMGNAYSKLQDYPQSFSYYEQAIHIADSLDNEFILGLAYNGMGDVYIQQLDYKKAEKYLFMALKKFKETDSRTFQIIIYNSLADMELQQKKYHLALNNIDQAFALVKPNEKSNLVSLHKNKYLAYKGLGKYKQALQYHEMYFAYSDSILNEESQKTVQKLEAAYQKTQKEKLISEQSMQLDKLQSQQKQETLESQKTRLLLVTILSISFGLFVLVVWLLQASRYKRKIHLNQARHLLLTQQLALSKKKMEPHFMLNMINNIGYLFKKEDGKRGLYYLGKFADLMRSGLMNADKTMVYLEEEMKFIEDYLILQKPLMEDDLHFDIQMDQEIKDDIILIPHSLIYTFVENAIKHGLRPKEKDRRLEIKVENIKEEIKISIKDNGVGRKKSKELNTTDTGQGMEIVKTIIKGYNQLHGSNIHYLIGDVLNESGEVAGTLVEIWV